MKNKTLLIVFLSIILLFSINCFCFADVTIDDVVYETSEDFDNMPYKLIIKGGADNIFYSIILSNSEIIYTGNGYRSSDGSFLYDLTAISSSNFPNTLKSNLSSYRNTFSDLDIGSLYSIENIQFSNFDLKDENGEVVFYNPPQVALAPIVEKAPMEEVIQEVVKLIPIVIVTIVGLISLRKALQLLSRVLHNS